jgi:hypothetical protein
VRAVLAAVLAGSWAAVSADFGAVVLAGFESESLVPATFAGAFVALAALALTGALVFPDALALAALVFPDSLALAGPLAFADADASADAA